MPAASSLRSDIARMASRWENTPVGGQFASGVPESQVYAKELRAALIKTSSDQELVTLLSRFIEQREEAENGYCAFGRAIRSLVVINHFQAPPEFLPTPAPASERGVLARFSQLFRR